jgi:hypothetical protein
LVLSRLSLSFPSILCRGRHYFANETNGLRQNACRPTYSLEEAETACRHVGILPKSADSVSKIAIVSGFPTTAAVATALTRTTPPSRALCPGRKSTTRCPRDSCPLARPASARLPATNGTRPPITASILHAVCGQARLEKNLLVVVRS